MYQTAYRATVMSGAPSSGPTDIERLSARLAEELESWFIELICPVCHVVSGKIAVENLAAQRAFDDLHKRCYAEPFSDSRP